MNKKQMAISASLATLCLLISSQSGAQNFPDLDLSGYIMLDYNKFDGQLLEDQYTRDSTQSSAEIRRARLSLKSDIADNWKSKFQLGFADGESEIKDAYLKYTGWTIADITVGQQKEGFGLESRTSSRNTLMIERSMISEALDPGRSIGVSLAGESSSIHWQLGYYMPNSDEATSAITGKVIWLPWQQHKHLFHLGLSFSERHYDGNEFRINESPEVYFADSFIEGDKVAADSLSQQGLELLWLKNRFTMMAQWQQAQVTSIENTINDYQGGFVQFGYQLSGGYRKYKNAKLGASSEPGWELTGRYSYIKLIAENQDAETYTIGVNYTVNKNIKFMANYIQAQYFQAGSKITSGDAIALRLQYTF